MIKNFSKFIRTIFKSYFFDSAYINAPGIIALFLRIGTLPVILMNLSIVDYGIFQFVLALQIWSNAFTGDDITGGSKRGIARGLDGTFLFAFLARLRLIIVVVILGLAGAFVLYQVGFVTISLLLLVISIYLVSGILPQASLFHFLLAKKRFKEFAVWKVLVLTVPLVAAMIAAVLTQNIVIFAVAQLGLISLISLAGFFFVLVRNRLLPAYREGAIDREVLPFGIKMIPAFVVMESANKASEFIIGSFFGFANLAIFSVAAGTERLFKNFLSVSEKLFYPDFAKREWEQLTMIVHSKLRKGFVISTFLAVFLIGTGYVYITLFLPESYQMARVYLLILGFALPPVVLQGLMQAMLQSNFRYKELTFLSIIPNIIKILLILIFGYLFGIIGIVWSIVLSAWVKYLFHYLVTMKRDWTISMMRKLSIAHIFFDL